MKSWMLLTVLAAACGGSNANSKYPSRPTGCDVQVFQQTPTMQTDNIGPVSASCDDQAPTSKDDCLRELKDQVCKLGGDAVWGVDAEPKHEDGKWKYSGRAVHTR